ncbi:sulfotransferase domain-containing protein [Hyphobacterium sp. HN65]|uniref:Sulfotransferase domain-containing protein n=1 Tax=Hyphobacterium lacteum TaxID=3116575 RepID=A0ABU7LPP6_9PROT|nr:sulfotransferase domain-containing protein [Hyphobacterium sp. HN65]MEE2525870.1 sulfotransferase domain-containing protein [Hyphobacterium sp. HN65]
MRDYDVILQNGMAKSGNYWLYNCLQTLMAEAGVPMRSYIQNHVIYKEARTWSLSFAEQASIDVMDITPEGYFTRISSKFSEEIIDLDAHFERVRHLWSHSPYRGAMSDAVYERCRAVFYIVRDPRDALLSQADFMFSEYGRTHLKATAADRDSFIEERTRAYPVHWAKHVGAHLGAQTRLPVTIIQYEAMKADLPGQLSRLASAMGLNDVTPARAEGLAAELGFNAMKARSNSAHLNKGRTGRWRSELTGEQQARFVEAAGELMTKLGYAAS